MTYNKIITLDTDFISKMYDIKGKENERLLDKIMEIQCDMCCCHSRIVEEVKRHDRNGALLWLNGKIESSEIEVYSDNRILEELAIILPKQHIQFYVDSLKDVCENFKSGYFNEVYIETSKLDYNSIEINDFVDVLNKDEKRAQLDYNLGELKTFILIAALQFIYSKDVYIFCSDDVKARKCIVSIGNVRCISVLSSFLRLVKEVDFEKDEAIPFINSYLDMLHKGNQKNFKIQDANDYNKIYKVECDKVLKGIFDNEFIELKNGMLRYRK